MTTFAAYFFNLDIQNIWPLSWWGMYFKIQLYYGFVASVAEMPFLRQVYSVNTPCSHMR